MKRETKKERVPPPPPPTRHHCHLTASTTATNPTGTSCCSTGKKTLNLPVSSKLKRPNCPFLLTATAGGGLSFTRNFQETIKLSSMHKTGPVKDISWPSGLKYTEQQRAAAGKSNRHWNQEGNLYTSKTVPRGQNTKLFPTQWLSFFTPP